MIDNTSTVVRKLFRAIKRGDVDGARTLIGREPLFLHARTGAAKTDTPLLVAVLAGDKAMISMLLEEGSPVFSILGDPGRVPFGLALHGEAGGMLEAFIDHARGVNGLVDRCLSEGRMAWMLSALARGSLATTVHQDLLIAALESVGRGRWPENSKFSCIGWPWSEAHNWADPSDDFIAKLGKVAIPFPGTLDKLGKIVCGPYTTEQAWMNTMANIITISRGNNFSNRWLEATPDQLWLRGMPTRPTLAGEQPPRARSLIELCAGQKHVFGLQMGLKALSRSQDAQWVEYHRLALFKAACGEGMTKGSPSPRVIRILDKQIPLKDLGMESRGVMVGQMISSSHDPHWRAAAIAMFLDGPDTLPSIQHILKILDWPVKSSKAVSTIVLGLIDNGFDVMGDAAQSMSFLDLLKQHHPGSAANISAVLLSGTPTPTIEVERKPRL